MQYLEDCKVMQLNNVTFESNILYNLNGLIISHFVVGIFYYYFAFNPLIYSVLKNG